MDVLFTKDEFNPELLGGARGGRDYEVFPLTPRSALRLTRQRASRVRLPIDFLSRAERESILDQAKTLSMTWNTRLDHDLFYKDIDLLECCRLEMMAFFQDVLAGEMIAPRLLADLKPTRALFSRYPTVASADQAMHDGTSDILEAVLQWRFRAAGVDVVVFRGTGRTRAEERVRSAVARFRGRLVTPLRSIASRFGVSRPGSADPRRLTVADIPKGRPIVTGLAATYDVLVIWPVLKAIAERVGGFPLVINVGSAFVTTTTRSGLRLEDDLRFVFVGDIPRDGGTEPPVRRFANRVMAALSDDTSLPGCLRNPLLKCQFEMLFNRLVPSALDAARRAVAFFGEHPSAVYLDDYCAGAANRAWTEAGNRAGIPTLMMPHGAVNLIEFHDYNAQWALAWGELGRQNLVVARPENKDRVIVVGDPSMDRLRTKPITEANDQRKTILLLTGGFLHQTWSDMDLGGFLATWDALLLMAAERPHLDFLLRPHPSDRDLRDWYRDVLHARSLKNFRLMEGGRLEDVLPSALCSVLVGKPGTAGIVSALAGVPFVYLDTMLCRTVRGYEIWQEANGVPHMTTTVELSRQIDRLWSISTERGRILNENERFRERYLSAFNPASICTAIGMDPPCRRDVSLRADPDERVTRPTLVS